MGNRSLFKYNDGLSHINYSHPEFQPIFAEEDARLDDAKTKCGGTKASKACIFDYLATGDIKLAESSGDTAKESSKNLKIVGKYFFHRVNFCTKFLCLLTVFIGTFNEFKTLTIIHVFVLHAYALFQD